MVYLEPDSAGIVRAWVRLGMVDLAMVACLAFVVDQNEAMSTVRVAAVAECLLAAGRLAS